MGIAVLPKIISAHNIFCRSVRSVCYIHFQTNFTVKRLFYLGIQLLKLPTFTLKMSAAVSGFLYYFSGVISSSCYKIILQIILKPKLFYNIEYCIDLCRGKLHLGIAVLSKIIRIVLYCRIIYFVVV